MNKLGKVKKPKSLRQPMPIVSGTNNSDNDAQFELELCWCVQQLETALNSGKLSQKVAEDTAKNLKVLKGNTAPLIKKRQIMKAACGDYRAKMRDEEKKMSLVSKHIKFTPTGATEKSSFVKKSAILSSGKDFKFNFDTAIKDNQSDESVKETTDNSNTNNYIFTSGSGFKFNFIVEENDEINFNKLMIK